MMAGLLPLAFAVLALVDITFSCQVINGVKLTNYGYPDTPHPHQPAYKCNNESVIPTQLGDLPLLGNGSYGSPYSAAARDGSEFGKCELLYVPILKKYFRVSDDCWACKSRHVDLYLIQANQDRGQSYCEAQFGILDLDLQHPSHEVIRYPGIGFDTDTRSLYVNGKCYNNPADGRVFPDRDGRVSCGTRDGDERERMTSINVGSTAGNGDGSDATFDLDPKGRHAKDKKMTRLSVPDPPIESWHSGGSNP